MLELEAVRFYRDSGSQTLVHVFWQVPLALLERLESERGAAVYAIGLTVRDSSGLVLLERSWTQTVSAELVAVSRGSTAEWFTFATRPGGYRVAVSVTDSASGRVRRDETEVRGYPASPGASDLLLASDIRAAAGPEDTVPGPGELRKGGVFLRTSGRPVLTPQQPRLGYYLEVYRARPETIAVVARVVGAGGAGIVTTPAHRVAVGPSGGVTHGVLDLSGLPPGAYHLELLVQGREAAMVRRAEFRMAGFETDAAIAASERAGARDRFTEMTEPQLDSLYLPLVYLMTDEESSIYHGLSVTGKRAYLRQFWRRRDPTPATAANEAQDDFYRRIDDANRRFREGGAAQIPGWRTDRGRIFIKYGPPDEVLQRPQAGSTNPYEVWKYTRARALKYVFLDVTQFGNYALIHTNDRREPSRPNWEALLGPEAVIDVERF